MSDRPALVDDPALLAARIAREGAPLQDGTRTTFVFRGEADAVRVRHWVYGLPSTLALGRLEGTDVWCASIDLPPPPSTRTLGLGHIPMQS